MATQTDQTFLLVSILGTRTNIEAQGNIGLVQSTKKRLSKEPQWKKFKFQVRTPEGYKHVKILTDKKQKK